MTNLYSILSRLDLAQYIDTFCEEGFETWETVLDITESDLQALGVKLGHRRVLQKEIAHARGVTFEQLTSASLRARPPSDSRGGGGEESKTDGKPNTGARGKRKYMRHPKADENAPERPPSAYVIFSNKIREELKSESLSFTAIAKRAGNRWQDLPPKEKEPYESEATSGKEKYHGEMSEYKTTTSYREHQQYLTEFKAKNASNTDGKRPKLAKRDSTNSIESAISQPDASPSLSCNSELRHVRLDSIGSGDHHSTTSGFSSPAKPSYGPTILRGGISSIIPLGNASPNPISPSTPSMRRDSSTGPIALGCDTRPSIETRSERMAPGLGHQARKEVSQQQSLPSTTLGSNIDPRLQQGRMSPAGRSRRSTRIPSSIHHDTSDTSSKSSIGSSLSAPSTTPSSHQYSPGSLDDGTKAALSLPPLSSVGPISITGPLYTDPIARPIFETLAGRNVPSYSPSQNSPSPLYHSSTTGKFESLQLPLPHNISFGQRPLPRPTNEEKLANIFDLQDIPRERNSLRNLSLEQAQGSATPPSRQVLPKPQHSPHHPALPTLPPMTSRDHDTYDPPVLHYNADPLSVCAYAGRLVGRETHRPPS